MEANRIKKGPNPEFEKPGINTFMDILSESYSQGKTATPIQSFRNHLQKMEKVARAGDIPAWHRLQDDLPGLAEGAKIDLEEDLEIKVKIHQIELTLLLKAGHRALRESKRSEQEAAEAQIANNYERGQILLAKAQKLSRLGQQLHNQLLAKTA